MGKAKGQWVIKALDDNKETVDNIIQGVNYVLMFVDVVSSTLSSLSDNHQSLQEWTLSELQAAWAIVKENTDLTLEVLANIEWLQIASDLGNDVYQLVILYQEEIIVIFVTAVVIAAVVLLAAPTGGGSVAAGAALLATLEA
ncbi:hypothetical protein [Thorsellia kenyensis]|uniref:Uncharacterized protein n=1 Tax=Thorsellia kenyensis TaxID=1549888 RepID=A0ABV6CDW9_9GAMM